MLKPIKPGATLGILFLLILSSSFYSCENEQTIIVDGECEIGDYYIDTFLNQVRIERENVELFDKTYRFELSILDNEEPFIGSDNSSYFTNKIEGLLIQMDIGDTLDLICIEYWHDEGACGPQQDSVAFHLRNTKKRFAPKITDSLLIGTWKGDWYKGDRIELIRFGDDEYIRRNFYKDGSYIDHPLQRIDSAHAVSYVNLDESSLEYYRVLEDGRLGFFSTYIMFKTEEVKENEFW